MGKKYQQLSMDDRNRLQRGLNQGMSLRAIATELQRNPSTLSRECDRGRIGSSYEAVAGRETAWSRRRRGTRKLALTTPLRLTIINKKCGDGVRPITAFIG